MVKSNANVTPVTSLGRNGLYDWVIQRVSAVLVGLYFIGMVAWLGTHPDLDFDTWQAFMGSVPMQLINTVVFVMIAAHAWVGLWTVTTDYITKLSISKHFTGIRLVVQVIIALLLVFYLLFGLYMIWGGI